MRTSASFHSLQYKYLSIPVFYHQRIVGERNDTPAELLSVCTDSEFAQLFSVLVSQWHSLLIILSLIATFTVFCKDVESFLFRQPFLMIQQLNVYLRFQIIHQRKHIVVFVLHYQFVVCQRYDKELKRFVLRMDKNGIVFLLVAISERKRIGTARCTAAHQLTPGTFFIRVGIDTRTVGMESNGTAVVHIPSLQQLRRNVSCRFFVVFTARRETSQHHKEYHEYSCQSKHFHNFLSLLFNNELPKSDSLRLFLVHRERQSQECIYTL